MSHLHKRGACATCEVTCDNPADGCTPCETATCGNGICDAKEDCAGCAQDCGTCMSPPLPNPCEQGACPDALWHADADADMDLGDHTKYWKKEVTSGDMTRLTIVNDPKGIYGKVYQAFITPTDISNDQKRAEFSQALLGDGNTKLKLGVTSTPKGPTTEVWFGWRSLFGKDIAIDEGNSNDGNYMQLKGDSSCGGPAVGMTIKQGRLALRSEQYLAEYGNVAWNGPMLASMLDSWHSLVLHVNFSKDASKGFLEVWLDGQPQVMSNGQTKIYFPTMCPNDTYVYPKLGTYGMDVGVGEGPHHWFDSPRIGTSFDAVVPR